MVSGSVTPGAGPAARRPVRLLGPIALLAAALFGFSAAASVPRVLTALTRESRLGSADFLRLGRVRTGFARAAALALVAGAGLLALPRRVTLPPRALALAAGALAALAGLAELEGICAAKFGATYGWWDPFDVHVAIALPDAYLGHVLKPGLTDPYHTSERGLRGASFPEARSPGTFRIVTLGDSITFGWGLYDDGQTYPAQLERALNAAGGAHYQVINAGVPRYASLQVQRLFESRVPALAPDLVLVCVGWNDLADSYDPDWTPAISLGGQHTQTSHVFDPGLARAARRLRELAARHAPTAPGAPAAPSLPPGRTTGPRPGALAAYRENLTAIVAAAARARVRLAFLDLPTVLSRGPMTAEERAIGAAYPSVPDLARFEQVLDEVCTSTSTPLERDAFGLDESGKGPLFASHCHPNARGAEILAGRVAAFLKSHALLR